MGVIRNVAIAVLSISFLTFVAFFGRLPAFRNTPIGSLHRVLWVHIPSGLSSVDGALTGGRLSSSFSRLGNYLLYEKHPIVLFFFLGLITGCAALFIPKSWTYLTFAQKLFVAVLLPWPYYFTYLCQLSHPASPHLITPTNHAKHVRHYPYDHILYHAGNICRTCQLPKPARSKHCSLCKACVARSDHHCIWVNNCVGFWNYKYFLALLLSTSILLFYASYLAYATLAPQITWQMQNYPEWFAGSFDNREDYIGRILGKLESWANVLGAAIEVGGLSRGGVGLLATLTAPLPLGLLGYHVYLVWAGMTTNETAKWADWKDDMNDGLVFMADIKKSEVYGDAAEGEVTPSEVGTTYPNYEYVWPVRSRQFLVRTSDGQAPRHVQPQIERLIVEESWRPCWRLADVENIYDQGFWENLIEVLRF